MKSRIKLWNPRLMPERERTILFWATVGLALGAVAMNVPHVIEHLGQSGIKDWRRWVYCWIPDALLFAGLWRIRYQPLHPVAWAMILGGLGWLVWAALSTVDPTSFARIFALAPIGLAGMMALLLELKDAAAAVPGVQPAEEKPKPQAPKPVAKPTSNGKAQATDDDLEQVVKPLVRAGKGRPTIQRALKDAGLAVSTDRLVEYMASLRGEAVLTP